MAQRIKALEKGRAATTGKEYIVSTPGLPDCNPEGLTPEMAKRKKDAERRGADIMLFKINVTKHKGGGHSGPRRAS